MTNHAVLDDVWEVTSGASPPAEPRRRHRTVDLVPARSARPVRCLGCRMALRTGVAAGGPLDAGGAARAPVPQSWLPARVLGSGGAERAIARRLRRRPACARIGGIAAGAWLATVPAWLVGTAARSAELIDPGGPGGPRLAGGALRRGRLDGFPRPGGVRPRRPAPAFPLAVRAPLLADPPAPSGGTLRRVPRRVLGVRLGDAAAVLLPARVHRLPRHVRLARRAGDLISAGGRVPPLGIPGALLLAFVVPFLPFLQVRYAAGGPGLGDVLATGRSASGSAAPRGPSPSR